MKRGLKNSVEKFKGSKKFSSLFKKYSGRVGYTRSNVHFYPLFSIINFSSRRFQSLMDMIPKLD